MKWVDVKGFEGIYQVNIEGACRSLDRTALQAIIDGETYKEVT